MACLSELRKHQVIDKKVYDQKLMDDRLRKLSWDGFQKNMVMDSDVWEMRGQVKCWALKWLHILAKQFLRVDFLVFVDHKITRRKAEELHILNGTDTLDTWSICDFS